MKHVEIVAGKSLYVPGVPQWWVSSRQRIVVLTFPNDVEAEMWDENPTLEHLVSS